MPNLLESIKKKAQEGASRLLVSAEDFLQGTGEFLFPQEKPPPMEFRQGENLPVELGPATRAEQALREAQRTGRVVEEVQRQQGGAGRLIASGAEFARTVTSPTPREERERIERKGGLVEKGLLTLEDLGFATQGIPIAGVGLLGLSKVGKGITKAIKPAGKAIKKLEPLAQEARKYKSAEEFVKAQPTTPVRRFEYGSERFPAGAQDKFEPKGTYYGYHPSKGIVPGLPRGAKSVELSDIHFQNPLLIPFDNWKANLSKQFGKLRGEALSKKLIEVGYDGIITTVDGMPHEIVNLKGLTKSQLIDFYNQAVKVTKVAKGKKAEIINVERIGGGAKVQKNVEQFAQEASEELSAAVGKKLTHKEVRETAKISSMLRQAVSRETTKAQEGALCRSRQNMAALAKEKKVTKEFIDSVRIVKTQGASIARQLGALRMTADPEFGDIRSRIIKKLVDLGKSTDEILGAAKGVDFNDAEQAAKFFRTFQKATLTEIIDEYRYINLLSSPRTHLVNLFSNVLQVTALAPTTKLVSGITDIVASKLTGKAQQHYLAEVPAYAKGFINSLGEAIVGAKNVMTGKQLLARPDIERIPTLFKPLRPFRVIPQFLEANDVFFRTLAKGGELEALAVKYAKQGKKVNRARLESQAEEKAAYWIFRQALDPSNKTGQGALLSSIDQATSAVYNLRKVPGVKWFVPFVQTPMNILKQGVEFSPLGVLTMLKSEQKIEQLSKAIIGSTVMAGAGWLALHDRITWAAPRGKNERTAFFDAGMQAYSVKIGDKWVSYAKLGPLSYPLAMAAAIKWYTDDNPSSVTESSTEKAIKVFSGIGEFISDQSYLEGIGKLVDFFQRGDTGTNIEDVVSGAVTQLVPLSSLQRWVTQIIDPIYRKPDSKEFVERIIQNIKKGIPGLSSQLPAYETLEGEPSKRQFPLLNAFSPVSVSKESPEKKDILLELRDISRIKAVSGVEKEELDIEAERIYEELKGLSKTEAIKRLIPLQKENPQLVKKIRSLRTADIKDYTAIEQQMVNLGVENGDRAQYIYSKIMELPSKEAKNTYMRELIEKKIITKDVYGQLKQIIASQRERRPRTLQPGQ